MKRAILILILLLSSVLGQDRSIIFNTSNPYYTCAESGGNYSNYSCDNSCNMMDANDYCTILMDGFNIDVNNTLADKFSINDDYALEAFGIYLALSPEIADITLEHTATIQIHADNNNSPGEILGEWTIDVSTGYYHNLFVGDGCITLNGGSDYWISAHVDYAHTELIWLYTQYPFYSYSLTSDNGTNWQTSQYGIAGAAAIYAEQIFYTNWQPAQNSADINLDGTTNVVDVVQLVQYVLGNLELNDESLQNADFNQDDSINVLDVVSIVSFILNGGQTESMPNFFLEDINPASEYYGDYIGPEVFQDDISIYYFGKAG